MLLGERWSLRRKRVIRSDSPRRRLLLRVDVEKAIEMEFRNSESLVTLVEQTVTWAEEEPLTHSRYGPPDVPRIAPSSYQVSNTIDARTSAQTCQLFQ